MSLMVGCLALLGYCSSREPWTAWLSGGALLTLVLLTIAWIAGMFIFWSEIFMRRSDLNPSHFRSSHGNAAVDLASTLEGK